jgi:hypothetical protein
LLNLPGGDIYNGNFMEGNMHGEGYMMKSNGDKYEGLFIDNFYEGEGILYTSKGVIRGIWEKGEIKYIIE